MEGSGGNTLRAKYLDWCSARLAERFLDLSPEEIYALARPDAPDASGSSEPGPDRSEAAGSSDRAGSSEGPDPGPAVPAASPPSSRPGSPRLPRPTDEGYRVLVQRVTEALLQRTSLPTFEQWAEAYAEDPQRFEAELLGFWKDAIDQGDSDDV